MLDRRTKRSIYALADALRAPERDYRHELYTAYQAERKDLNATALTISGRYDSNLLYVGGGALAVSLTFLEKVAPDPQGWLLYVLLGSWVALILGLLAHLEANANSQAACARQIEILDETYNRYLYSADPTSEVLKPSSVENRYGTQTARLTRLARALILSGVGLLCAFSGLSLAAKGSTHAATTAAPAAATTAPVDTPASAQAAIRQNSGVVRPADEFVTTATTNEAVGSVRALRGRQKRRICRIR